MKKHFVVFSLLSLATSAALAWVPGSKECVDWLRQYGSNHPDCNGTTLPPTPPAVPVPPPPVAPTPAPAVPTVSSSSSAEQQQQQNQAQRQAQLQSQFAQALNQNDIRAAASLYAQLSPDMRNTVSMTVSPEQRQALENQIAINNQSSANAEANGNGSPVTITDQSRTLVYTPVQTASLPPTLTVAGIEMKKYGECGPQWRVKAYDNAFYVPRVWGLWHGREGFKTMHGELDGRNETPFRMETLDLPEPIHERVVIVWGHQLYMIATHATQGGGGSGAANHAGSSAFGIGTSLSANASHASIGVVVLPCEYRAKKADTKPPAVPLGLVVVPDAPALAQDKAPFVTSQRRYLGPVTPRETDTCPLTQPGGKVVRVKKQPGQVCASAPVTAPAVTDARLTGGKK